MTPAARHQAAIEILDQILAGAAAEQVLTRWARGARFAGSGDRAAIRDLVFEALRCKRSCAHLGGAMTGRGLILGLIRAQERDSSLIFTGAPHAPAPLNEIEAEYSASPMPEAVALDCPDWLLPIVQSSLGPDYRPVLSALRLRAPVFLRVNLARTDRATAQARLAEAGISTEPHPLAPSALEVTGNARAVQRSTVFSEGLIEMQDAASQAVIFDLPSLEGRHVLDFCAGGGGKALAMAALGAKVTAHDANPGRMRDLPARAARAGVRITQTDKPKGLFDLVLTDVPCSGSGSWRRAPVGKWSLSPEGLAELTRIQAEILDRAALHVSQDGWLAYVTCSLLDVENGRQISEFLARNAGFRHHLTRRLTPHDGGDGFFLALMRRVN
ncbi:MAG: RsmB/NOP family class I SAM-dependent RNA methyltransferase [Roseinatronobacter sp.]